MSAAEVESAGFVRVLARADGDSLAASGVLARAFADREIPFQVSVAAMRGERSDRAADADHTDELTLVVGDSDAEHAAHLESGDRPASLLACDLVRALETRPDPVLTLAGGHCAGIEPGAGETEWVLESALERGLLARRGGIAVPTGDLADGLAHTTACCGPWSGDHERATATLEALETDDAALDHRRVASLVTLDAIGAPDAGERASRSIGRFLRPYELPNGPFETLGGYADVLEATAKRAPGLGVALALDPSGDGLRASALETWRTHGREVHEALETAETSRYDGLFVARTDAAVTTAETVARLAVDYRSPEPVVLATATDGLAVATAERRALASQLEALARDLASTLETGVDYDCSARGGSIRLETTERADESTLVTATREVFAR
ncbi:exonuclease [Natronobiforma cellulositropha]|uniref:exonuclease n=1 Tax=Natronobiforma cellulositropha TaxID=1679076 RepID=UPI0021D5B315|nr:exonuclease [Natronobiforma cellulositropha]